MFSKQFTGRASALVAAIAAFATQQREEDEANGVAPDLVEGRQRAIAESSRVLAGSLELLGQAQATVTLQGSNAEGEPSAYSFALTVASQPYPDAVE